MTITPPSTTTVPKTTVPTVRSVRSPVESEMRLRDEEEEETGRRTGRKKADSKILNNDRSRTRELLRLDVMTV